MPHNPSTVVSARLTVNKFQLCHGVVVVCSKYELQRQLQAHTIFHDASTGERYHRQSSCVPYLIDCHISSQ